MITNLALIRLLGAVGVLGPAGYVSLGGALPRGLVAVLALEVGRPVGLDRIAELLWGHAPPDGVKAAVQQTATRARRTLAICGLDGSLRAAPPGYVLDIDPGSVDLVQFRRLAGAAADSSRSADHNATVETASAALALWEGRAVADLVDLPVGRQFGPFVDDERWRVEELRGWAMLAVDRAAEAADLLAVATAQEPLRERLWVLYATALAEAGRTTEAQRATRAAVEVLAAELGVAPGAELLALGQRLSTNRRHTRTGTGDATGPAAAQFSLLTQARRRAFDDAERAALDAQRRRAHADAIRHWSRALDLLRIDESDDDRRQRALIGLGEAHNQSGDEESARAACLEAIAIARRRGDATGLGWAVLGYCADRIRLSPPPEQEELLEAALAVAPEDDPLLRSRLLARLATERYWAESADACRELAMNALRVAEAADDSETRLLARYALAFGNWTPPRAHQLVEVCEAYLVDACASGDRFHELLARRWLAAAVSELGDVERGGREAALVIALADELDLSAQQWVARIIAAAHALLAGDLVQAERLSEEALVLGSVTEPGPSLDYASLLLWTLRWVQGRLGEIAELVEEVAAGPGVELPRRLGLALTHASLGREDQARAILDGVDEAAVDALPMDASWYAGLAALAEAAALTHHVPSARIVRERFGPYRDRIAITTTTATGPIAHHLGLCAWVLGERDAAIEDLCHAVEIADRSGMPAFGARSRVALAQRLASCGRRDEALLHARAARETARRLGMVGTVEAADQLLGE